jgi:hypothetical protein
VRDGRELYVIDDHDRMPPFFMTVVSSSDHWLFVSSTGGLTAGREHAALALFPYETVDKLHDSITHTGPVTLIRVDADGAIWQPFGRGDAGTPVSRRLAKHVLGASVTFEETAPALGLEILSTWETSDRFGLVRRVRLTNTGDRPRRVSILDGIRNVLPTGIPLALQQGFSVLADAYKTSELDVESGLGVFALTAAISDQALPQESLFCATVWSRGLPASCATLDPDAVAAFRAGAPLPVAHELHGRKGAYLVTATVELAPGASQEWVLVAEVNQSQREVVSLLEALSVEDSKLRAALDADVAAGVAELEVIVGKADGFQAGADRMMTAHHACNVLFNVMRGGAFERGYDVRLDDFRAFLTERNRPVADRHEVRGTWADLPAAVSLPRLLAHVEALDDAALSRLALEYLPLGFSRRHGDPSRPWNQFSIQVRGPGGARRLGYEGNWRDIFQNWEALCVSYPVYLPSVIAKFVNASTTDGFNPYRIGRGGIDWEVPDPRDPWAHIGYWGDHQIAYLLRLLEWCERFFPGKLTGLLSRACFSYADVPYRLRPYDQIAADPRHTIDFDEARAAAARTRAAAIGADGRLLVDRAGAIVHVTLAEKLLVTMLAKLSAFIPGAGLWLFTQRPEWNDANNALVGHAASLVTLFHLRRFQQHCAALFGSFGGGSVAISGAVASWFAEVHDILAAATPLLDRPEVDERDRRRFVDDLGRAFERYRVRVAEEGLGEARPVDPGALASLCATSLRFIDHTLAGARREDGLYDAYVRLEIAPDRIHAHRLAPMLEGQVAAIASGRLAAREVRQVLGALRDGPLYRADQNSYLLYPAKRLPRYLARNKIPPARVRDGRLVQALAQAPDVDLIVRDARGDYRFDPKLGNAEDLAARLEALRAHPQLGPLVALDAERARVLEAYEATFRHAQFTGRSGTMYAYEGLGCIYWHMVSKLLLAVGERALDVLDDPAVPVALRQDLLAAYEDVRAGLSFNKTPAEYGAFPMDAYSHTPPWGGAQQPGMTGQVKEGVLVRFAELGVRIEGGCVRFDPRLLAASEFCQVPTSLRHVRSDGTLATLPLAPGELGFSYCQVPIVYRLADRPWLTVFRGDGPEAEAEALGPVRTLPPTLSAELFERRGNIARIVVEVDRAALRAGSRPAGRLV